MGSYRGRRRRIGSLVSFSRSSAGQTGRIDEFDRAIQYAKAQGLKVLGIDGGEDKAALCAKLGADAFIDFTKTKALCSRSPSI
jgi:NADPH-dependent curcumin reductase CurA